MKKIIAVAGVIVVVCCSCAANAQQLDKAAFGAMRARHAAVQCEVEFKGCSDKFDEEANGEPASMLFCKTGCAGERVQCLTERAELKLQQTLTGDSEGEDTTPGAGGDVGVKGKDAIPGMGGEDIIVGYDDSTTSACEEKYKSCFDACSSGLVGQICVPKSRRKEDVQACHCERSEAISSENGEIASSLNPAPNGCGVSLLAMTTQ